MQTTIPHLEELEALPFWERLSDAERTSVLERHALVRYAAGAQIRGGDADCLGLLIVLSGALRAYLLSPEGRELTLYQIRGGEVCVLSAFCALDAVSFETHVVAEQQTEALLIPIDVFSTLVKRNVAVECFSYKTATERFSDVVAGLERLVFYNLEQRIASFLLDEAARTGAAELHMTHEHIAAGIASARESVSRALKNMADQGLVELFRGGVRVRDKAAMYQILG